MTDKPYANATSLHRIARDHGLTPSDLAKAVVKERGKPVSDRMAVGEV